MVRICRYIPPHWETYSPIGDVIPNTRFIIFKTPLNERLLTKVRKEKRFSINNLLRMMAESNQRLGLIIDLTDTNRYYDKNDVEGMCIEYEKISCPGRGFVDNEDAVTMFNNAIQKYTERSEDPEALIGVHCTDGINRSGYLVCRFLIDNLGWSSHEALEARGYPIANGSYVQELHKAAKKARELASRRAAGQAEENSDSGSEERRKKKKKNKRKREPEDEDGDVGNLMQQFLGEIQQQAQEIQAAVDSPLAPPMGYVDSPRRQHWAYAKRAKMEEKSKPAEHMPAVSYEMVTTEEAVDDEGEEEAYEEEDGIGNEAGMSRAQKRRIRKMRQQKMLNVMKRGNFHEIREMQEEYMKSKGSQL